MWAVRETMWVPKAHAQTRALLSRLKLKSDMSEGRGGLEPLEQRRQWRESLEVDSGGVGGQEEGEQLEAAREQSAVQWARLGRRRGPVLVQQRKDALLRVRVGLGLVLCRYAVRSARERGGATVSKAVEVSGQGGGVRSGWRQ